MRRKWWLVTDAWIVGEAEKKNSRSLAISQTPSSLFFPVKKFNTEERTAIILFIFPQTKWVFSVVSSYLNFSYQICVLLNV